MKPVKIRFTWVLVLLVLVIAGVVYARSRPVEGLDGFAQCLSEKGAVMYGTYWCSHCNAQKADFGDAFSHIEYVECSDQKELCAENDVQGFPTWIIDGAKYEGRQPLSRLSALTGCDLEKS
ncbi:hypothetical protein ACFL3V_01135 [Nanoarchaeota archaeon]